MLGIQFIILSELNPLHARDTDYKIKKSIDLLNYSIIIFLIPICLSVGKQL